MQSTAVAGEISREDWLSRPNMANIVLFAVW